VKARTSAEDFAEAARRHLDDVQAFLVYLTGDRAVAEDLTAETFAKALERWHRFDPRRGALSTWLCQLARSTALDHFRSEERRRRRDGRYAVAGLRDSPSPNTGSVLSQSCRRPSAR
jgi:RNA polymerase sigma factor (sigma-70 family)